MITLKEIAEKCSVSITTVSNILNGKSNVSEKTKQRVLEVVKETGYRPNYMARGLRASKTNSIGIIIDDLTEFSSTGIIDGIMSYFDEHKYKAILENLRFYSKWGTKWYHNKGYEDSVQQAIDEFVSIKVDGIIYVAGHARCISCIPENLEVPEKNIHTQRRLEGYKKALSENGLEDPKLLKYANWDRTSGYEAAKELLSNTDCTAVFCFNDLMAAGVYDYLNEKGLTPGKDISVAGFDNRTMSQFLNPALTTVEIPLVEIGRKSAELILNQIASPDDFETQQSFVECKIIERDSVKAK